MDKIDIKTKNVEGETASVFFDENKVLVNSYLSVSVVFQLITQYLENYFSKSSFGSTDVITAEYGLILNIFELCTSVKVAETDADYLVTVLWPEIEPKIKNYFSFRQLLSSVLMDAVDERKDTLESSLKDLFKSLSSFLEASKDISPEFLREAKETVKELKKEINEPVMKNIFIEAEK